jgi:hypothetical protein
MSVRFRELDEALGRTRADVREGLEGVTDRYWFYPSANPFGMEVTARVRE